MPTTSITTGFAVYSQFVALKMHFTSKSYDFHKYAGKTTVTHKSYMNRKDRFFFEKIARKVSDENVYDHIVGNLTFGTGLSVSPEKTWIGTLASEDGHNRRSEFQARVQSIEYIFKQELTSYLKAAKIHVSEDEDNEFPFLLTLYYEGKVSHDTMVILDHLSIAWENESIFEKWDRGRMLGDPIFKRVWFFIEKYRKLVHPNITQDIVKYDKIARDVAANIHI